MFVDQSFGKGKDPLHHHPNFLPLSRNEHRKPRMYHSGPFIFCELTYTKYTYTVLFFGVCVCVCLTEYMASVLSSFFLFKNPPGKLAYKPFQLFQNIHH